MNKDYMRIIKALMKLEPNLRIKKVLENGGVVVYSYENGENYRFQVIDGKLVIDEDEEEMD